MSILIRGMEMPNICAYCFLDASECDLHAKVNIWRERHPNCPLIELPPHGRLGDLDELINGCEKLMRMLDPEGKEYLRVFAIKSYLMWAAEYAVIEAEGETK